jgi:hypothetical protein
VYSQIFTEVPWHQREIVPKILLLFFENKAHDQFPTHRRN